jgi:hypothetical protein
VEGLGAAGAGIECSVLGIALNPGGLMCHNVLLTRTLFQVAAINIPCVTLG